MKHSTRLKTPRTTRKRPYGDLPGWFAKMFPIRGPESPAPPKDKPEALPES